MTPLSLSTMWGVGKFERIEDFVAKAQEMGFSHIELNYQLPPEALAHMRGLNGLRVSSIHAPCPDAQNEKGIAAYRIPLTSLDREDVEFILRLALGTVDLAAEMGAQFVVVHVGSVTPVVEIEREWRNLYKEGKADTEDFRRLQHKLIETREAAKAPYLERAHQVLKKLQARARERGVRIGLETRYYYHEIPNLEEMEQLLAACDDEVVGFWHDAGHAENLARLGFTPHREWLERLGPRIVGIHLHDFDGIRDHCAPGNGNLDWALVAKHLPLKSLRVLEVANWNEEAATRSAIAFLEKQGIL